MRYQRFVVVLLLAIAPSLAVIAAQDLVFRTSVDLVTVDVSVLGDGGEPVADLGADDFAIQVDGKMRRVVSAQFISATGAAARPLPARHFTTNETIDAGRLVVVAVDEAHIRRVEGRQAMNAAAGFLDRLDRDDRVAVTSLGVADSLQFTRDRAALRRRLEMLSGKTDPVFLRFNIGLAEAIEIAEGGRARLADVVLRECGRSLSEYTSPARTAESGVAPDACPEQVEQESRAAAQHARSQARMSLAALTSLVDGLKQLDGPKTVVLLSEGIVMDPRLVDVTELAAAAKDARVTIYALQMEIPLFEATQDRVSPTFLRDVQLAGDGLERLAGSTRGAVFRLVGSDPAPFDRIARELSGYYLLAFEAIEGDRNGRTHRIDVSLTRRRGAVRGRAAFRLPAAPPSASAREQDLVALLRAAQPATELPVRATTYMYAEPDSPQLRVVVSAEAEGASGAAAQVLLGYVLLDDRNVIVTSGAQRVSTGSHVFSTVVPAGTYTLRVGGIDALGRRGLVERPFVAAVHATAALRVSDLMLAPVPPQPDTPLQPLVDRVTDARVTGYLELYARDARPLRDVQVVFDIAPEDGSPVRSVSAATLRRDARLVVARATIPLDGLAMGRYVAHARVTAPGEAEARVSRPFTLLK